MKKIYIFLSLVVLSFVLVGCNFFNETTTATRVPFTADTTNTTVTTTTEINADEIASDVYARIYSEIYQQVKDEVSQNLSDEKFDEIYNAVISSLQQQIDDGTIQINPETIVDMIKNIENTAANAVIGVSNLDTSGSIQAIGSGVIYKHVGDMYYVVTNNHVVENGSSYQVRFEDGSTLTAHLMGVDSLVDVAVLYFISDDDYPVVQFADSDNVQTGDIVVAVGNPSGYDFYGSMTMGIVSGTNRYFDIDGDGVKDLFVGYIQHDAAINGGNSGGALFDINGDVLGINVIKLADISIEGMGFAIPSNLVKAICADIEEYGYSIQKPMLGIQFLDISAIYDNQAYLDQNSIVIPSAVNNEGFYITAVTPGATLDGIVNPRDIITDIGDIHITSSEQFIQEFSKYKVGDVISITIYRNGQFMTIDNIVLKAKVES